MTGKLTTIGHICNDTEPTDHLGGGVSYSGVTAKNLGSEVTIITKAPKNHRYLEDLKTLGISSINLSSDLEIITTFKNVYDEKGNRKQTMPEKQEEIEANELHDLSPEILKDSAILIATISDEVDTSAIPYLSQFGMVALTPQGYFRKIQEDKTIEQKEWLFEENDLRSATIIVISDEDLSFGGSFSQPFLEKLKLLIPIVILTCGEQGVDIFQHEKEKIHINIFKLLSEEIKDFTGSGDCFAAAFIAAYSKTKDVNLSGTFAALYSAIKIMGLSGIGIDSIPTKEQVKSFVDKNPDRIKEFLEKNNVDFQQFKTLL